MRRQSYAGRENQHNEKPTSNTTTTERSHHIIHHCRLHTLHKNPLINDEKFTQRLCNAVFGPCSYHHKYQIYIQVSIKLWDIQKEREDTLNSDAACGVSYPTLPSLWALLLNSIKFAIAYQSDYKFIYLYLKIVTVSFNIVIMIFLILPVI